MQMKKLHRLVGLQIDRRPLVELDYHCIMPNLLYARAGVKPMTGDAYAEPGFEKSRDGIKKLFAAMLFDKPDTVRKRFPKDAEALFNPNELGRVKHRAGKVVTAIKDFHAPVAHLFGTNIGPSLFFTESTILIDVLLSLKKAGIVALPIHDALLTRMELEPDVWRIMRDVFKRVAGVDCVVKKIGG